VTWRYVSHTPTWAPAHLPINAAGDTTPGYVCTHQLENGNGRCGGNVFDLAEAIGDHGCIVDDEGLTDEHSHHHEYL
jgi:hypothetical protein